MFRIGLVAVYGEHEADPGGLSVLILPHAIPGAYPWWSESTASVIESLRPEDVAGKKVLDFGCGASAILALVMAKMGATVTACEIHPIYAAEAERQIAANDFSIPVKAKVTGKFDFAVANVGDAVLVGQVSRLAKHGIGTDQQGELIRW